MIEKTIYGSYIAYFAADKKQRLSNTTSKQTEKNAIMLNSTKNQLTQTLAVGVAAIGALGGVGLATAPAHALDLTSGTGGVSGDAILQAPGAIIDIDFNGLPNPAEVTGPGTGQFAIENGVPATVTNGPTDFKITGGTQVTSTVWSYTVPAVDNFLAIKRADGQVVTINLLGGSSGTGIVSGANYQYNFSFIPARFDEPGSEPDLFGSLTLNASSNTSGSGTSQTYQITFNKNATPPTAVPEPSAVLGLGLLSLGAFFKRKNQDSDKA